MKKKRVVKKVIRDEPKDDGSTPLKDPKREFFCVLFTSTQTPKFHGNGKEAYAFAYDHYKKINTLKENKKVASGKKLDLISKEILKSEHVCAASAARLLTKVDILKRCNYLVDQYATDQIMDREALYVVTQKYDLNAKMRAIERFDKIKGRIIEKLDLKHTFEPIESFIVIKDTEQK